MSMVSIANAAKILGVNKKTLLRWDASGKFPAHREPNSGNRYYEEEDIRNHSIWFTIRRKHREHNRKLTEIRKDADKFLAIIPLKPLQNPPIHDGEEMKKAYAALRSWEAENEAILNEYSKLPSGFTPKVDPDA